MRGKTPAEELHFDPEIERTIRMLRREMREGQETIINMEPEPLEVTPPIPIRDRTIPVVDSFISCIVLPLIPENVCDIKVCIQMIQHSVQFGGK